MPFFRTTVLLFSDAQYRRGQAPTPDFDSQVPPPFDPSTKIEWSPIWSLRDKRFKYLPTSLLYFFYRGPGQIDADSNGCAAGNTLQEAIVQGFLELVERDAYAIWWYNRLQRPQVDLSQFDNSYVRDLQAQFAEAGRRLWVLDVTSDLGVPTFVAISHWVNDSQENIEFGSGAHFDARIALLRALTELNQFLSIGLMGGGTGDKSSLDGIVPFRLQDYPFLSPTNDPKVQPASNSKVPLCRHARAGGRLRADCQESGLRLPRARSDSSRHRRPRLSEWSSRECGISIAASRQAGSTMFRFNSDGESGRCRKTSSIQFIPIPEVRPRRERSRPGGHMGAYRRFGSENSSE